MSRVIDDMHPHLALYVALMEQLKQRTKVVDDTMQLISEGKHYAGTGAAAEFALLQLRFCCELVALGCVAIHSDVPHTSKLQKMWNAGEIMNAFERLKEEYFPTAIYDVVRPDGMPELTRKTGDILTKDDLIEMYNYFGKTLHAGSFIDHIKPRKRLQSAETLSSFVRRLKGLLSVHTYTLYERNRLIRIIMQDAKTGHVKYNVFAAVGKLEQ
jgi:hypothetical protein